MADYAIHEETLYDIADVIRKKEGSSALIDPADYAGRVNLMGMLEEKTVSGSIVAFADGADAVKLKSCEVTIAPNLDGVSSVGVVQTGKNILPNTAQTATDGNVTFTVNSDGSVSLSGIASTEVNFYIYSGFAFPKTGNYKLTGCPSGGSANTYRLFATNYGADTGSGLTINVTNTSTTASIRINIKAGVDTSGLVFKPQIEVGSTATAYEPYITPTTHTANLGRTIYGGTPDVVNGTGTDGNAKTTLDDTGWTYYLASGHNTFNKVISGALAGGAGFLAGYTWEQVAYIANQSNKCFYFYTSSSGVRISIRDDDYTSLEAWQAHIDGRELVYPKTPEDFTFTPVPILSRLGDNTMWGDGDLSVVYRSSGTQTLIPPTLISKTITENGTYSAEDDGADGYDEVTVNVSSGAQNIETVLSSNPLIEVSGVSGTDVSRTMWTYTATASGKIVFHANTQVKTNTGANDGYFTVKKNNTVIATTYANTSTTTSLVVPDIDIVSGDVVTVECGFDNYHTSAWFDIYSTITILTESAPSLLMGGFGSSNSEEENTNSEEENSNNEQEETENETV